MTSSVARLARALVLTLAAACAENTTGICEQSVVDYCADDSMCPAVWAQAKDPDSWACWGSLTLSHCGHAKVATHSSIDISWDYFYDTDDKLVGVALSNNGRETCLAGVVPETECVDPNPTRLHRSDCD